MQKKTTQLTHMNLQKMAEKRLSELIIIKKEREELKADAPKGRVHIINDGKWTKYYLRKNKTDKMGVYLRKSEKEQIRKYVQKAYDERILRLLEEDISILSDFLEKDNDIENRIRQVYSDKPDDVKRYIDPVDVSDEDFVKKWLSQSYQGKEIDESVPFYETEKKERVRSKSELNIANALAKHGIPYKYECPLILKRKYTVYPDFTILDVKRRRQLYWEHRGMMNDADYCIHAVRKTKEYLKNGIVVGKNLIITEEASSDPLGTDEIEAVIKGFL